MDAGLKQRTGAADSPVAWRIVGGRALGVTVVASLMGLAFNASNPLGVRWTDGAAPEAAAEPTREAPALLSADVPPSGPAPVVIPPATNAVPNTNPVAVAVSSGNLAEAAALVGGPVFASPSQTSWAEVKPLAEQGKVVLVDARSKPAFDAGHIPGATLLPEDSGDEAITA
ncbi:MAG: hypothetical protein KDM81_17590, partial [Verrucomicrobiae bacterium]|nr:hypothetical protein [Verrucomicrobiae bacterium]